MASRNNLTPKPDFVVLGMGSFGVVAALTTATGRDAYKTFLSKDSADTELETLKNLATKGRAVLELCGLVPSELITRGAKCEICSQVLLHVRLDDEQKPLFVDAMGQPHFHVKMPLAEGDVSDLFSQIKADNGPEEAIRRKARVVHKLVGMLECITKNTRGQWACADAKLQNVLWRKSTDEKAVQSVLDGVGVELFLGDIGSFCNAPDETTSTFGNPCFRPGQFPKCHVWMNVFATIIYMVQALDSPYLSGMILNSVQIGKKQKNGFTKAEEKICKLAREYIETTSELPVTRQMGPTAKLNVCIAANWRKINTLLAAAKGPTKQMKAVVQFPWDELLEGIASVST